MATFFGREAVEERGDGGFEVADGAGGGFSEQALQFGESQFDWIQIGAVGWQVLKLSADRFDGFADAGDLVSRQVVENQDVSGLERRRELLLHIGEEELPIHGTVDHERSCESRGTQAGDEGCCFPMTMGHVSDQALATPRAPVTPRHLGVGSRFIEKHQSSIIERGSPKIPTRPAVDDIGPLLFSRMQDFF